MLVTSEEALPAGSYQPITLLRISARATVVVVFPMRPGTASTKRVPKAASAVRSSTRSAKLESSMFTCDEETVTLPV